MSTRKKLAFATVVIVGFGIALELAARGLEYVRSLKPQPNIETAVRARFHPLRYELAPGGTMPANGPVAKINSVGLRGADPDQPKRRVRVLCLGDSCTFGYAPDVTDSATYPAALGRRLDPAWFEVLNGGMPGFGSLDCLNDFLYKGVELQPDVVVILAGWNDSVHAQPSAARPPPESPLAVLDRSALLRLERRLVARFVSPRPLNLARERERLRRLPPPADQLSDVVFARTERVFEDMVALARFHHCEPVLVTYPNFSRPEWAGVDSLSDEELRIVLPHLPGSELSPKGWRKFIATTNDLIRAVAARNGVGLVEGDAIRDLALFHDICHLNLRGCEVLARRVAPVVEGAATHQSGGR